MVSIESSNTGFILKQIYDSLSAELKTLSTDSIENAFCCWIYPNNSNKVQTILSNDFSVANYNHVAHLGYLITISPEVFDHHKDQLADGLVRIIGRPANNSSTGKAPFHNDAIAILGLALGAKYVDNEIKKSLKEWLETFVDLSNSYITEWKRIIMQASLYILSPNEKHNIQYSNKNVDLQLALKSRGIDCFENIIFDNVYHSIVGETIESQSEVYLSAARLQAINFISRHLPAISIAQPTLSELKSLLTNITSGFRRWVWEEKPKTLKSTIQKWNIENEYHVQSLLFFLLAPIFPDIESEFYLEPIGQLNSRADIGLPSLNLIIEVKFLRKSINFQKMIEEIASDNSLYFNKNSVYKEKYNQMLVFLWDDSKRDHEHHIFSKGVLQLDNIVDCVVISRPGIMIP